MPSDITPDDELTQAHPDLVASFVVRFWQEAPGCWRGTVRHVQSQAQRGVSSADEAGAFNSNITFGMLETTQAMGDRQALLESGRKVIRFHLSGDIQVDLARLTYALE